MSDMFSEEDARELVLAFPNSSNLAFPPDQGGVALIPSLSGDGFVRSDILLQKIDETIESEAAASHPRLSQLAISFDIGRDALVNLLSSPQSGLLLDSNAEYVLSRSEVVDLRKTLEHQTSAEVVEAACFAGENRVALECIPKLISTKLYDTKEHLPNISVHPSSDIRDLPRAIIFSQSFFEGLVSSARITFEKAQESAQIESIPRGEPVRGSSPSCGSTFLQLVVNELGSSLSGRIAITEGKVVFTPMSYIERQRDEKLKGLSDGTVSFCSLQWFTELIPEQHTDISHAERYIRNTHGDDVLVFFDTVVSKIWYDNTVRTKLDELLERQIVNTSDPFQDLSPDAAREAAGKTHSDILTVVREQNRDAIGEGVFPYLILIELFNTIQDSFTERIRQHAKYLWERSDSLSESELTLDILSVLQDPAARLNLPGPLIQILLKCGLDGGAKANFNATLAELEAETDAQFAQMWKDRVIMRFEIYHAGVQAITDAKLSAQLQDLLRDYVVKELVPEAVARLGSKGLVRSAQIKRNVKKLQTALQSQARDMQGARASLHKFASKLDITPPDEPALRAKKEVHVADMVRGMQKDTDGPRLFLTLVVVLLAKKQEGVVYATGKFAPKIMKLLRGDGGLGDEVYGRLEALKDKVKAGKIGQKEREEMRSLAEDAQCS